MLNSTDEILQFARLDLDTVQSSEVEDAINFAQDVVNFHAPESDAPRDVRAAPLRKRAHQYLATSELYQKIAPFLGLKTPPKQTLGSPDIQIGTDFPTQIGLKESFEKAADRYWERGMAILKQIAPVVATIRAGSID